MAGTVPGAQTVRSNVVLFGDVSIHSLTSNQACWVNLKGNLCRFKGKSYFHLQGLVWSSYMRLDDEPLTSLV